MFTVPINGIIGEVGLPTGLAPSGSVSTFSSQLWRQFDLKCSGCFQFADCTYLRRSCLGRTPRTLGMGQGAAFESFSRNEVS